MKRLGLWRRDKDRDGWWVKEPRRQPVFVRDEDVRRQWEAPPPRLRRGIRHRKRHHARRLLSITRRQQRTLKGAA